MPRILGNAGAFEVVMNAVSSGLDGHPVKTTICDRSQERSIGYRDVVRKIKNLTKVENGWALDLIGHTDDYAVCIGSWTIGRNVGSVEDAGDMSELAEALGETSVTTVRLLGCKSAANLSLIADIQSKLDSKGCDVLVLGSKDVLDSTDFNAAGLKRSSESKLINAGGQCPVKSHSKRGARLRVTPSMNVPKLLSSLDRDQLPWLASIPLQFPERFRWEVRFVPWERFSSSIESLVGLGRFSYARGILANPKVEYASCQQCNAVCNCDGSVRLGVAGCGTLAIVPLNDGQSAVFEAPAGASWATILELE